MSDIDKMSYLIPVSLLHVVLGSVVKMENISTKLSNASAVSVRGMVQIASSPCAVYASFKDRDQMVQVSRDLPIPIDVWFLQYTVVFVVADDCECL
jgi:hypothetical protein